MKQIYTTANVKCPKFSKRNQILTGVHKLQQATHRHSQKFVSKEGGTPEA